MTSRLAGATTVVAMLIIGLRVDSEADSAPALRSWGLFGFVSGAAAEIRGVTLQSPAVAGTGFIGALVGYLLGTATVADSAAVGGTVTVTDGEKSSMGGLVGSVSKGTIRNSYATGAVTGGAGIKDLVGGLVGLVDGIIRNSYATGAVTGGAGDRDDVGGLAGELAGGDDGTIQNSYATGAVDGGAGDRDSVGGLVGSANGTIQNNYATGAVTGGAGDDIIGGLVGTNNGVITNSYYGGADMDDGETNGDDDDFNDFGEERTPAQLQCPTGPTATCNGASTYTDWSTANWDFGSATELPSVIGTDGVELLGQPVTP